VETLAPVVEVSMDSAVVVEAREAVDVVVAEVATLAATTSAIPSANEETIKVVAAVALGAGTPCACLTS